MHFNDSFNRRRGLHHSLVPYSSAVRFSNRTGIVAFDVDARGSIPGGHGFWFNIFISDSAHPGPYQNGAFTALFARAGVGIEFESVCSSDLLEHSSRTSSSRRTIRLPRSTRRLLRLIKPRASRPKMRCRITSRFTSARARSRIFASDAGEPSTFRSIMVIDNVQVPLSRGYVHLQHTHYNATKCTFTI